MKKAYVKPEMFYEEYELSTSIAGNCSMAKDQKLPIGGVTYNSGDVCVFIVGDDELFNANNCRDYDAVEGMYCYQQPDGITGVFNS